MMKRAISVRTAYAVYSCSLQRTGLHINGHRLLIHNLSNCQQVLHAAGYSSRHNSNKSSLIILVQAAWSSLSRRLSPENATGMLTSTKFQWQRCSSLRVLL